MIRRITLQNYMSHGDTIIEPATGLTVLVGPNNCGKSAVVSALETLCNNALGSYMVRHDEKEARVTVETDDGHTFVWRRRGNTVSYIIDGRDIHRVGRGIPDDLHTFLRLPKVDAGENGEPFDVHFGPQKSPIFLLNEPESRAALFFASSSDAAILLEMQKRHRDKVKVRKNDEKRLSREIEKLHIELKALEPLEVLAGSVARAEGQYQELKDLAGHIQTLVKEMEALCAHSVRHDQLLQEYECLAPLKLPPHLADTSSFETLIAGLVGAECQLQRETARCCALENLDGPPALDDVHRLESLCRALMHEERNHRNLKAKAVCLGLLADPPVIADIGFFKRTVVDLELAQLIHVAFRRQQLVLENLTPPPQLVDPVPLAKLIAQFEGTLRDVGEYEASITARAVDMAKLEGELHSVERVGAGSLLPSMAGRLPRGRIVMALGGFAILAAFTLLFIFGPAWFGRLDTGSSDRTHDNLDSIAATVAEVDNKGIIRQSKLKQAAEKETPETSKEKPKKEEPKKEPNVEKQLRLKQVRQLLNDAEMANEKGKNLEAVLGFGQAAVLYPEELAEVENLEKLRLKFIDALKRYQAEVERALQKAAKQKAADQQPDP